jgi:lysophospholipase L1-like esterase
MPEAAPSPSLLFGSLLKARPTTGKLLIMSAAAPPQPPALRRIQRGYTGFSLILLNTALLLLFANLACAGAIYVWHSMRKGDADFRLAGMSRATALKAYPGWAADDVGQLLRETCGRHYQYEPYTGFSERPFQGKYVNIEAPGFRSIGRAEAWPPSPAKFNVFVFGGSTTFGWAVPDAETIPASLQRRFDADGQAITVYNFGRDGYFSSQESTLLSRLLSDGHVPSLAIFIDGLNDFANWKGEPDFSDEIRQLVDARQSGGGLGPASLELARQMPLWVVFETMWQKTAHYNRMGAYRQHTDPAAVAGVVSRWRAQKKLIEGMAHSFHFQTAFVWQPIPVYRYDLTQHFLHDAGGNWFDYGERAKAGYPVMAQLRPELEQEGNFLWLADEQEGRKENLYVDGFHYSAAFSQILADRIARFVEARINPDQTRSHNLSSVRRPARL